ncbi:MAG: hypothetical protein COB93_04395 [Sneathiella sp.]|nr:MAG: hypothetical protein COB93_04395 [Sneathiella sp.]
MMVKELVIAVSLGLLSALLLFVSIIGNDGSADFGAAFQSLVLWTLSLVPLFVSGLGFGVLSAGVSVLTGALLFVVLLNPVFGATYAVLSGAPVILLARQALLWREHDGKRFWYPTEYLMLWWVGICVILTTGIVSLLYLNDEMRQELITGFDQALSQLKDLRGVDPTVTAEDLVAIIPLVIGPMWGVFILLGGCLAQGLLVRFDKNMRPTPRLTEMELPKWSALALIATTALFVIVGSSWPIIGALVVALGIAYFFQGMAVIMVVTRGRNGRPFILGAIYVLMFLMFWPIVVVIILGLIEKWIGFRRRFAVTAPQEED